MARRGLFVPSRFDVEQARKDLESIKAAAKAAGDQMRADFLRGASSVDDFLKGLRNTNRQTLAAAREAQQRGFLDAKTFRDIKREADRAFNDSILPALAQMRREGKQNTEEFQKLQRALKNVGERGGSDVKQGFLKNLAGLPTLIRGSLAAGILASFTFIADKVIGVFRGMVNGIRGLLETAGRVAQAQESFFALTLARGLSAQRTIEELRRGTRGLVSDLELMKQANFALQAGLPVTEESLGRLAEVSRRLARATGRDATEAFQRLINGIVKGEQNVLEELGLFTRLTDVLKQYTRETGRSSDALSQQEKILLFYNAVLAEAEKKVGDLGDETLNAGDRLAQMTTFLTNLRNETLKAIADTPKLVAILNDLGDAAGSGATKVQDLADKVGALVDTLLSADTGLPGVGRGILGIFDRFPFNITKGANVEATKFLLGFDSDAFDANLERRRFDREIQNATDLNTLLEKQLELHTEKNRLIMTGLDAESDEVKEIERRMAIVAARARAVAGAARAAGAPPPGKPEGTDSNAAAAAKRAADERVKLEKQVADQLAKIIGDTLELELRALDEIAEAYRRTGQELPDQLATNLQALRQFAIQRDQIHQFQEQLQRLSQMKPSPASLEGFRQLADAVRDYREVVSESVPLSETLEELLERIERQAEQVRPEALIAPLRETYEITIGLLREQLAKGLISEDEFKAAGERAMQAFRAGVVAEINRLRAAGQLDENTFLALTGVLGDQPSGDDPQRVQQERIRNLREQARTIEENARAAIRLAEAFGLIDEETAAAMENVASLAASVARIAGGDLSAIPSALASLAGLAGGIFGGNPEHQRIIESNTKALDELRAAIEGWRLTFEGAGDAGDAVRAALRQWGDALSSGSGLLRSAATDVIVQSFEAMFGVAFEEIERIAEDLGITIRDEEGALVKEGLKQLAEATDLARMAMQGFTETPEGIREREERRARLEGRELTPQDRARIEMEILRQNAPELFEQAKGFDLSTPEGRAALRQLLLEWFNQFETRQLEMGDLTRDEILDIFDRWDELLDEWEGEVGGVTQGGFQVWRGVTELTFSRALAIWSTMLVRVEDIQMSNRGILAALGGRMPAVSPPSVPPATTTAASAPSVNFHVEQLGPFILPDTDEATAERVGAAVGRGFTRGVREQDRQLGHHRLNYTRAHGT